MKPIATIPILLAASLLTPVFSLQSASYDTAEITRLHNQVKVVRSDNVPKDASVGEQIDRVSSVTTGDQSRAELRFPDKSLTRLGANSRFTLREGERTIDLDQGVMLLQVPKRIGGAKVRTAAVTAAVTGTTVMFEYLPGGYIKLIVIEGEVDLYFNDKPSVFRTVKAGEMIIMKADSNTIPDPVDIDLERLLKTSKLISGDEEWMPNYQEVADAVKDQKEKIESGELVGTTLYLPGRGTQVVLESKTRLEVVVPQAPTPGSNSPGSDGNGGGGGNGNVPPGSQIPGLIAGTTVLNETSTIETNPHVNAFNSITGPNTLSEGFVYDGSTPFPSFAFGSDVNLDLDPVEPRVQNYFSEQAPWAVFKFEDLLINGTPYFTIIETPNVILSSLGDIRIMEDDSFGPEAGGGSYYLDLNESGLNNLTLYSHTGSITLGPEFDIYGSYTNLALVAVGPASDINIYGNIYLDESYYYSLEVESDEIFNSGSLLLSAGRDINMVSQSEGSTYISAASIDAQAGRDINLSTQVYTSGNARFTAKRHINVTSSGTLAAIASDPNLIAKLEALEGNITIDGVNDSEYTQLSSSGTLELAAAQGNITINNSALYANVLKAQVLGDTGWITIGNNTSLSASQIMKLYAEGTNGGVRFNGIVNLNSEDIRIAGRTVEITSGGEVRINGESPSVNVYTDFPEFNKTGKGSFKRNSETFNPNVQSHGSRPAY